MTDGESVARAVWIGLVLLLVVSNLAARRLPLARLVSWTAMWGALFLGVYLAVSLLEPRFTAWQQAHRAGDVVGMTASESRPAPPAGSTEATTVGGSLVIPQRSDGHYWVDATINGQTVTFLVDSGASMTAVSQRTASELGLPPDPMSQTLVMQTANGPMTATRSEIAAMRIGTIQANDLPVAVSAALGDTNVLGMNFLNKLKSWRVEGGTMIWATE